MRIAISTDANYVSAHFGRCPSFTLVDIEGNKVISKVEVGNPGHSPGVIPQFLHNKGAAMIVCGGIGNRAAVLFEELGIQVVPGVSGSIDEVIQKLEKGVLEGGESLCTPGAGRGYGIDKTVCDHPHEE